MTPAEVREAVRTRFRTLVAGPQSLPTEYDNLDFTRPADAIWCRFRVELFEREQIEMMGGGGSNWLRQGAAKATLAGPVNKGTKALDALAAIIEPLFSGKTDGGVLYKRARTEDNGRVGDSHHVTVTFSFETEDVTT